MPSKTYRLGPDQIDDFVRSWSCNGLPHELDSIEATFDDATGDLIDYTAFDEFTGNAMDLSDYDGPALAALVNDARTKGAQI